MRRRSVFAFASVLVVVLVGTAMAAAASSPPRSNKVTAPFNVSNDLYAQNEESLGMTADGSVLAGAWNDWNYNDGCGFSYSTNGGSTWAPQTFVPGLTRFTDDPNVPGTGTFDAAGDPSVFFNPKSGLFDVICQAFGTKSGNQIQLLSTTFDASKANPSADVNSSYGAAAWTTPVAVTTGTTNGSQKGGNGNFPDHESIAVDTGTGTGHHFGRLYVSWAQFSGLSNAPIDLAYSDDEGRTWHGPIQVSDKGTQSNQDSRPIVAPDGSVYVTWVGSPNAKSAKGNVVWISKSVDGGNTWSPSVVAVSVVKPIDPQTSLLPNSQYRVFEDAWAAVDEVTGKVVIAYTDEKTGPSNIYAVHNVTAGNVSSWSSPVALRPGPNEQFFPWVSSAPNGRVDVVFYDRTCDSADTKNCVTLGSTLDDGATWGVTKMTTSGFDGDRFQACVAFLDPQPDCNNPFLGDYIAVSSTNSKAEVLWTGNGSQSMDVFAQSASF
jgi:hypothetical protein